MARYTHRKYCSNRCRVAAGRGKEQTRPTAEEMDALEYDRLENQKYWEKSQQEHIRLLKKIQLEKKLRSFGLL